MLVVTVSSHVSTVDIAAVYAIAVAFSKSTVDIVDADGVVDVTAVADAAVDAVDIECICWLMLSPMLQLLMLSSLLPLLLLPQCCGH